MKVANKVLYGGLALALLPLLCAAFIIATQATNVGSELIEQRAKEQLISLRESKKTQVVDYFENIKHQITTYSDNHMIVSAMKAFQNTYKQLPIANNDQIKQVEAYYNNEFGKTYMDKNNGVSAPTKAMLSGLSKQTLYSQYQYIANNPNPLGSKHLLDNPNDNSSYAAAHNQFHSNIRQYLESFGYYDIFLVDSETGLILYSAYKELDYMTSLKTGPYKDSGIGQAFKEANKMTHADEHYLTDFSPYTPSYEGAASFIASPIFDGTKKIGVLIFQMPVDRINNLMTNNQKWKKSGLGESGEIYIVGQDKLLRSESRFLLEDANGYYKALEKTNIPTKTLEKIKARETSLGLQPVHTAAANHALNGETGFKSILDYRNVPVLSAYAPLTIMGLNWAILAEIDRAEAVATAATLKSEIFQSVVSIFIIAAILAFILVHGFSQSLLSPLNQATSGMKDIASGEGDLTKRLDDSGTDELAGLAKNFNEFAKKIQTTIQTIAQSTEKLAVNLDSTQLLASNSLKKLDEQQGMTAQTTTAASEVSSSIVEVAHNSEMVSSSSRAASEDTSKANSLFNQALKGMTSLCDKIQGASTVIDNLKNESEQIGTVVDVIRGIAEQTNLLALNAAIEAARAGEQGRGFAVVADEVRSLASRTQDSTKEIESIVSNLQSEALKAVNYMNESQSSAETSISACNEAATAISTANEDMSSIAANIAQVATAAEEQSCVLEGIQKNIATVNDLSKGVAESFYELNSNITQLSSLGVEFNEIIRGFKIQ